MDRADKHHLQENEELAEDVRKYPCVYDKASEQYKDKIKVANAWKRVNEQLGFEEVMSSLCLRTRLQKSINSNISFCKIKVIFKSSTRLANFFRIKDMIPLCLRSNIVYKFACGRCSATYYCETCRHFKVRVGKHSSISHLTNKRSKSKKSTAVKDHMLMCDQPVSFDDFKVLASSNSNFHLKIKESLLISRDQPILNRNEAFLALYLFD